MRKTPKPNAALFDRAAAVGKVDDERRSVDLVWSTGAQVRRYNWLRDEYFLEELSLEPAHVRLARLNSVGPLLNSHSSWSLSSQIGRVEPNSAAVDGKEGRAVVRFSKREAVEPIWQDVRDKIITAVSVGYQVHKFERRAPEKDGDLPIYRAIDWEPYEVSLVSIPADTGAGVRAEELKDQPFPAVEDQPASRAAAQTEEVSMTEEEKKAAAEAAEAKRKADEAKAAEAAAQARAAEEARIKEEARKEALAHRAAIETIARTAGLDGAFVDQHAAANTALDKVRELAFAELAKRSGQPGDIRSSIHLQADEHDKLIARATDAVMARCNQLKLEGEAAAAAREFRGLTLRELARDLLERRGVKTRGMDVFPLVTASLGMDPATRASVLGGQGTSDLANILANTMNRTLRRQYDATGRTFTVWANRSTNPDFKSISRTILSGSPSLLAIAEGGEYKRGAVTDGKETYQLATYGRTVAFTRQAIINDDLQALTRLPMLMGRAAADLESDTVYAVLTANAALSDGVALFHASHGNLTGSGTAISVASLDVARAAMRVQTGLEGRPINLAPKYLIVPAAKEHTAYQFTSSNYVPAQQSNVNEFRQGGKTAVEPVIEPRLDVASAISWYLAADPMQIDTVEYCYLEGNEDPYTETRVGFEVDGVELKIRHDFAAKALDHRGLYKNPGA